MSEKILVDRAALKTVLRCLLGEPHYIREQQVLRTMDHNGINSELSPIGVLLRDFNDNKP